MNADRLAAAWSGGLGHVERLLAADVQLLWWSGDGPRCQGRDEVMALVRILADPSSRQLPELVFDDVADGIVLAYHPCMRDDPDASGLAFAVHGGGDQLETLVQYGSRAQALQHLTRPADMATTTHAGTAPPADHPHAYAAVDAIRTGDLAALSQLLEEHPELASTQVTARRTDGATRSLLHIATDWPGHFPSVGRTIALLVRAGADVNARVAGPHTETPLHWAASSDDVEALDALLDAGADIEAPGAVIGGGTALADATAFGQWDAARRLIERGARASLGEAASLGLLERIEDHLSQGQPGAEEITGAFWMACHGSQLAAAQLLRQHGADIDWIGWDGLTPYDAAARSDAADVMTWLDGLGARRNVPQA
jgi:hypothetical protein